MSCGQCKPAPAGGAGDTPSIPLAGPRLLPYSLRMRSFLFVLLLVALFGTLAVLFAGLFTMARGGEFNRRHGNTLMRLRVAMQGLAILIFLALMLTMRS